MIVFSSPIWLAGLLPWGMLAIYFLRMKRTASAVSFLQFWVGGDVTTPRRKEWHRPPMGVVCLMLAILLGILAAARPEGKGWMASRVPTTIVLDRGITMLSGSGGHAFRGVLDSAKDGLGDLGLQQVELIPVPGVAAQTTGNGWLALARNFVATAADTQEAMERVIEDRLAHTNDRVVVLSARKFRIEDKRLVQIEPGAGVEDVGIAGVSAREGDELEVMVTLRNQSGLKSMRVEVDAAGEKVGRIVELPGRGLIRNYFFDVKEPVGNVVAVRIDDPNGVGFDDRAWLVREKSWPVIEVVGSVSPAVARVVDVYSKLRKGDGGSTRVMVSSETLDRGQAGVWIAGGGGGAGPGGVADVVPNTVTADVKGWPKVGDARAKMATGFSAVVSRDELSLVGVSTDGARQVWVNLDLEQWARSADFVVFFSNVFGWVGGGGEEHFVAHRIEQRGPEWKAEIPAGVENGLWPGLYRGPSGKVEAVNAPDVVWTSPANENWRGRLRSDLIEEPGFTPVQSWICLLALICAGLSAAVWKKSGS